MTSHVRSALWTLPRICQKSPTFGYSYSTRNILQRICQKSLTFGPTYSAVLEIFYQEFFRKALLLVIPTVLEILDDNTLPWMTL